MNEPEYMVELSRRAERMLLQHTEFLARVSPNAAHRLIRDLTAIELSRVARRLGLCFIT